MFYVYEFRDQDGFPFYVGKGSKQRIQQHIQRAKRGIASHFYNKLRKLWSEGFQHQAVIVFETLFEDHAFQEEKRLISYYGRDCLTNQTDGGDGPSNPSEEVRSKISKANLGKIASEATRNRQRLSHLGLKHTEETKARISEKQKTIKKPWASALAKQNLIKMCAGLRGRKWSPEQREKFKKSRTGHLVSQETRDKISQTKKANEHRK